MKTKFILPVIAFLLSQTIVKAQNVIWTDETSNLPTSDVNWISVDKNNTKWFATDGRGGGLVSYDNSTWKNYVMPGPYYQTSAVTNDLLGNTWVGGQYYGLVKFPAMTQYNTGNSGINSDAENSLIFDNTGLLWIAGDTGIDTYDGSVWTKYLISVTSPLSIVVQKSNNNIWTTGGGGLGKFNGSWTIYNPGNSGLPSYNDYCVAVDHANNIWIGSDSGVTMYNGSTWTTYNAKRRNAPFNAVVTAVAVDKKNNIWVGTQIDGLYIYNGSSWKSYNTGIYFGWPNTVNSIAFDSINQVWVGEDNYLLKGYVRGFTETCPPAPDSAPSICYVSVDTSSKVNTVYWDKTGIDTNLIDSFRVYRKVGASYVKLGKVSVHSPALFADTGANPNIASQLYEISNTDSCYGESPLSSFHQTILLQANIGVGGVVNLNWNAYVGDTVIYYRILRDSNGNGNWIALDSVASPITSYTDLHPPVSPNVRYVINTIWTLHCTPSLHRAEHTKTYISSSYSNTKILNVAGINEILAPGSIEVFPNPTNDIVNVTFNQPVNGTITITDILGQQVYTDNISVYNTVKQISMGNLTQGVYLLKINSASGQSITKRIVKL